jgi:predicted PurR-regulated permease PerM
MSPLNAERSQVGWWTLGLALFLVVAYVGYSFVGTFVFGLFIYYATRPIHRRLSRRIRPPSLAAVISLFVLALPALLVAGYALLLSIQEIERLSRSTDFDPLAAIGVQDAILERVRDPETLLAIEWEQYVTVDQALSLLASLSPALDTLAIVGVGLVHLFLMIALAFYLLRDDHRLSRWAITQFGDESGVLAEYLRAVDRDLKAIFFGNILNAVFTGTIGVIAYTLLNTVAPPGQAIPAAAVVGLLAGAASLIPIVGMKLVYVPVAAYMALRVVVAGDQTVLWFVGAFVVVSFVVVDTIPDLLLRPYVSGRNLHVGSVMIAYVLGPLLFGWYGLFLLPLLLVATVHFARIVLPELVSKTTVKPFTVDPSYLTEEDFEWVEPPE